MRRQPFTDRILMVRPACFGFNQETSASNSFQQNDDSRSVNEISQRALVEFDNVVETLLAHQIDVYVVDDSPEPVKTDAVFPNNWISFHESGLLITYPMMAESRRIEIRDEILEDLAVHFRVKETWSMNREIQLGILEGTGSLVLDRQHRIAYACRSPRTEESAVRRFCDRLQYQPVIFDAVFSDGKPFYHTNVVMTVTEKHVVICLDSNP